jgi:hypothetical protein
MKPMLEPKRQPGSASRAFSPSTIRQTTEKEHWSQMIPTVIQEPLRAPGEPLDVSTRYLMESRFGCDFGRVRIHTYPEAAESARMANARAFASGSDVFFGTGEYRPETSKGRLLIAHELAHVLQDSQHPPQPLLIHKSERGQSAASPGFGEEAATEPAAVGISGEDSMAEVVSGVCQVLGVATTGLEIAEVLLHLPDFLGTVAKLGTLVEAFTLPLESMIKVLEAMHSGVKWGAVMGASYAVVAIAHGQEPPPPGGWMRGIGADDARKGWEAQALTIKSAMKEALRKNPEAFLASMARIRAVKPEQAMDQIYLYLCEEHLQETFLFIRIGGSLYKRATEVRLLWPGPAIEFRSRGG